MSTPDDPTDPALTPEQKFANMDAFTRKVMSVPKAQIDEREEAWKRERAPINARRKRPTRQ